jgi:hypothetical protein
MFVRGTLSLFIAGITAIGAAAQTQTTGSIAGVVRDQQGSFIVGAEVIGENSARSDKHVAETDNAGSYVLLQLAPATYDVKITGPGFSPALFHAVSVGVGETVTINATLQVARTATELTVSDASPPVRGDTPELSFAIESATMDSLPLPTRNFLQLLTLSPGVAAPLTNNNAIGRDSPNVSVNGARVTSNSYQINGIDAGDTSLHVFTDVAVPAPDSVGEVDLQTSVYDASVPGAGGSVQVMTRTGSNLFRGDVYEYFRNEALDANDANLKAASENRPEMRRNVYGATLGGPLRKNKAFFFASYQGTREANGATDQSLYKDVLITPGLTDDRSVATLTGTFGVPFIDPISLKLLNFKLSNGQFLIPTPQTPEGLLTGSAVSTYREEQFNGNLDYRLGLNDSFAIKFFYAHAPLFSALSGSNFGTPSSLPGFGTFIDVDNRVLSVQQIHSFSSTTVNELRFGYSFLRHGETPQESLDDRSLEMQRSTADAYPGLPLILLGRDQGGASIGTSDITYRGSTPSLSFAEVLSLQRGRHTLRFGGEVEHAEWKAHAAVFSYGEIDFPTFNDFLIGNTGASQFPDGTFGFAHLGTGLTDRDSVSTTYHFFLQDTWKITGRLAANLGLRYEVDPYPYDPRGRIGGFDPALYKPNPAVDSSGSPVGPPASGIIEAGNALPEYSLGGVTRVGKRIVRNNDLNNFGPRIGLAWSPLESQRLSLRGGYGIFYAPPSFFYLALQYFAPPFFLDSDTSGQPFNSPFANAPPDNAFPRVQPGSIVAATVIDRNARTPYVQQFNGSIEYELLRNTTLQVAYAGSHGVKLFRSVAVNQAGIASAAHPITNAVTGQVITNNSLENASLRAPMQGVSTGFFNLNQTTAGSTYHSLQVSVNRQLSRGLQFSGAYTFSKSIDNASNPGGGANGDGTLDRSAGFDTANTWGNQLDARANRGISDFDRTHYFVFTGTWELPVPSFFKMGHKRTFLQNWSVSGIVTAMSGLPVDIFDPTGGFLYGLFGARPNWVAGANRQSAMSNVPGGYYFNPGAFAQAIVQPGQPIPSAHDLTAIVDPASEAATDIGTVGRNVLRGPPQSNVDLSVSKQFSLTESKILEVHADLFNVLNHANRDNPVSDISTADFGKVVSFSSSPRIVQLAVKFRF